MVSLMCAIPLLWFHSPTPQILFLNKVDLFRQKIQNSDRHLRLYFAQYTGESTPPIPSVGVLSNLTCTIFLSDSN